MRYHSGMSSDDVLRYLSYGMLDISEDIVPVIDRRLKSEWRDGYDKGYSDGEEEGYFGISFRERKEIDSWYDENDRYDEGD